MGVAWHLIIIAGVAALLIGWRPARRLGALVLVTLAGSVSVLAFAYGNPFSGAMFALLAVLLALAARRFGSAPVRAGQSWAPWAGVITLAYALVYPHFLEAHSAAFYAIAAPVGLVPCPTLAALIGFTLLADGLLSRR